MNEEKYEQVYNAMLEFEEIQHEKNQRRIKSGIRCLVIIPVVFLVLMFLTSSSKPVFLILWIISLYGIGIYLIGVEYTDHKIQQQLAAFRGEEKAETKPLIGREIETVESVLRGAHAQVRQIFVHDSASAGKETEETVKETEKEEETLKILDLNDSSDEEKDPEQEETDEEHI